MPVAANHGTDMIMKMNVIRPPYLAWHTPQRQYHSRPGLFHTSTENACECCPLSTRTQPAISCTAHMVVRRPFFVAARWQLWPASLFHSPRAGGGAAAAPSPIVCSSDPVPDRIARSVLRPSGECHLKIYRRARSVPRRFCRRNRAVQRAGASCSSSSKTRIDPRAAVTKAGPIQ